MPPELFEQASEPTVGHPALLRHLLRKCKTNASRASIWLDVPRRPEVPSLISSLLTAAAQPRALSREDMGGGSRRWKDGGVGGLFEWHRGLLSPAAASCAGLPGGRRVAVLCDGRGGGTAGGGGEGSKEGGTETWEEAVRQGARQPSKARDELAAGVSAKASLRRGLFVHSRGDVSAEPHRRPSVGQSAFCRSHPLARDTLVPTGLFLRGFCSNTEEKSALRWHFPLVARQNSRSSGPNALLLQKGPLICIESDPTLRAPKIKSAATSLRLFGRQNCHYSSSWTVDRIRIETFSLDQKVCACACKWWWWWGGCKKWCRQLEFYWWTVK